MFACAGCAAKNELPATVKVSGKVTYRGQPVSNAVVTFVGEKAPSPSSGDTNTQGEFVLTTYAPGDGTFPGRHKVTISVKANTPAPVASGVEGADYEKAMQELTAKKSETELKLPFPQKYTNLATTDLEATVNESGINSPVLELKD